MRHSTSSDVFHARGLFGPATQAGLISNSVDSCLILLGLRSSVTKDKRPIGGLHEEWIRFRAQHEPYRIASGLKRTWYDRPNLFNIDIVNNTSGEEIIKDCELLDTVVACSGNAP
jgi:hypothetical protein